MNREAGGARGAGTQELLAGSTNAGVGAALTGTFTMLVVIAALSLGFALLF